MDGTMQGSPLLEPGTECAWKGTGNQPKQMRHLNFQMDVDTQTCGLGCDPARSEGKSIGKRREAGVIWDLLGWSY